MDRIPVWRLTRNPYGRRLWKALTDRGIRFTRLALYRTDALESADGPDLGPAFTLEVRRGSDLDDDAVDLPIVSEDRVVQARTVGGVVGSVVLSIDRRVRVDPLDATLSFDGGYLWALFVEETYRKRGIASALVAAALRTAAGETDACLALVAADNWPSQRVFESQGFTRAGTLTHVSTPCFRWSSDWTDLCGIDTLEF